MGNATHHEPGIFLVAHVVQIFEKRVSGVIDVAAQPTLQIEVGRDGAVIEELLAILARAVTQRALRFDPELVLSVPAHPCPSHRKSVLFPFQKRKQHGCLIWIIVGRTAKA
jgi:hypothetical protein